MEKIKQRMRESNTIEMSSKGGWNSAIFIIFLEVADRFCYYGVSGNLINYLTDVLGQPTATAAKSVNIWMGISAIFPLVGGIIADSYSGLYKTIIVSTLVYLLGLVALAITASAVLSKLRATLFFISLYIISIGEGGQKPCVQTFAADQFNDELPEEKATKRSFFNWWYVGNVSGGIIALLVVIYVQESVGWGIGYGMPVVALALALGLFLIGSRRYRRQAPVGSPFTRVAQVLVAAARKRRSSETESRGICSDVDGINNDGAKGRSLVRTPQYRFLDKAMMIDVKDESSEKRNPWRLCSITQVEEVKLLIRLIPIWACCSIYRMVNAQVGTYFTKQGSTMMRSLGSNSKFQIAPASFQAISGLTVIICIPIYDRFLVPFARKITAKASGITMLQRIGVGIFLSGCTMVVSALVEAKRIKTAREHGGLDLPKSIVPMKIWWLLPQYILSGISDTFTMIGIREFFYDQMPEEMKSVGAAAYISVVGLGNFMSSGLITVVQDISARSGNKWLEDNLNRAHLHYFYWILAGFSAVNFCVYILLSMRFIYKKFEMDVEVHQEGRV